MPDNATPPPPAADGSLRLNHADYGFLSSPSVEDPLMAFGGMAEPQQLVDVGAASDLTVTDLPLNSAATEQQQTPPAVPIKSFFFTTMDKETTLRHLEAWAKRSELKKRKGEAGGRANAAAHSTRIITTAMTSTPRIQQRLQRGDREYFTSE
jgi:hypothetical protein